VINPFSRWETKKWGIDKYTELADVLIDRFKVKVILVGIQEDKQEGKKIESNIKKNLINLVGETTLLELAVLLKKSNLLISCDSGPVHLANALGLKTITLFGPTSSRRTGAYLVGNIIVTKYKECAPCYKKKCSDLGCMKDIEVADIVREVEKLSF
jgi:ADP-heptose:LPS heptosyltransferase